MERTSPNIRWWPKADIGRFLHRPSGCKCARWPPDRLRGGLSGEGRHL